MFKVSVIPVSCLVTFKRVQNGNLRFDLEVQRRSVWTLEQKQDLIDSVIFGYPIPPLYFIDKKDEKYWVLDGQQRCRSVTEYMNNEFALSDNIDDFIDEDNEIYQIKGLKYIALPKAIQKLLDAKNFTTYTYSNITPEEIEKMFKRLNSGTPFKKIEIVRIDAGSEVMKFLNKMSEAKFFKEQINISDKSRIRFMDQEIILQIISTMLNRQEGFSGKEIQNMVMELRNSGIPKETQKDIIEATEFLDTCFDTDDEKVRKAHAKILKKNHLSGLFYLAKLAREKNIDILDFHDWVMDFFTSQKSGSDYSNTCTAGTATKEKVLKRIEILEDNFNKFVSSLEIKSKADFKDFAEAAKKEKVV